MPPFYWMATCRRLRAEWKSVPAPFAFLQSFRWLRCSLFVGVVSLGILLGAYLWLRFLFNESAAETVPSLTEHLKATSILAVFAHPDDEITVAGFLSEAAQHKGVVVRMITATRGESGHPRPPICRAEDLGKIREAETLKDGFFLGVQEQEVWTLPDGGLSDIPIDNLALMIESRLRKWKPDVVVTFEPASGFTLHPDHLAIGRAATLAVHKMATQEQVPHPRLLYPLAPRKALACFGGETGRSVADRQPPPQFALIVSQDLKVETWRIQQSQANYLRGAWGFPPRILYSLMDKEFYTLAQ